MKMNLKNGKLKKFKELEVCSYFVWENKVWQKMAKTKIRELGMSSDQILRKNVEVLFLGFDINVLNF